MKTARLMLLAALPLLVGAAAWVQVDQIDGELREIEVAADGCYRMTTVGSCDGGTPEESEPSNILCLTEPGRLYWRQENACIDGTGEGLIVEEFRLYREQQLEPEPEPGAPSPPVLEESPPMTAWTFNAVTYSGDSLDTSGVSTTPRFTFGKSGERLYVVGNSDDVHQYNLTTAYDVTTATLAGKSFTAASSERNFTGIWFQPDGLAFYVVSGYLDQIAKFTLTTAWELDTAAYDSKRTSLDGGAPADLVFSDDGLILVTIDRIDEIVRKYSLTTAWDMSTIGSPDNTFALPASPQGNCLFLDSTGTYMFNGGYGDGLLYRRVLSTPWDVSTAGAATTYNAEAQVALGGPVLGCYFTPNGEEMFLSSDSNNPDRVFAYDLVAQSVAVSPGDLDHELALDAGSITQDHQLAAADLDQELALEAGSITQDHQLTAAGLDQELELEGGSITQDHQLAAADLDQELELEGGSITQDHQLAAAGLDQELALEPATIAVAGSLSPADVEILESLDGVTILQDHQLEPADLAVLDELELVTVTVDGNLQPATLAQIQELTLASLTQDHQLEPADLSIAQLIGGGSVAIPSAFIGAGRTIFVAPRARAVALVARLRAFRITREV